MNQFPMTPFDAIASTYDTVFSGTQVGRYQRTVVAGILQRRFQPGMRVLELGCGTGVDAVFLAQRGVLVTAVDASSGMAEAARRRIEAAGMQDRVEVIVCPVERLSDALPDEPFDGLFSNFGVLNCVTDHRIVGATAARWLKPGGFAVLCLMNRWCAWEISIHLARVRVRTAFRRLGRRGADARIGDGVVRVTYPSSRAIVEACRPYCAHAGTTGVGVLIPPSYLEPLVARFSSVFRAFWRMEQRIGRRWPFNRFGDHYCVELQRTM